MKRVHSCSLILHITHFLLFVMNQCQGSPIIVAEHSVFFTTKADAVPSDISPSTQPQPFIPLLAPSPLGPSTSNYMPKLSGLCSLNFSAAQDIMTTTATDCWTSFAPYLANVLCCPQFDAMMVTLIGQLSKYSGVLALNSTHASHCLSDVQKLLVSQGASESLKNICSVHSVNLTGGTCPIVFVDEFESIVDSSRLLTACRKIDPVHECCDQVCQSAIDSAARKIALNDMSNSDGNRSLTGQTTRIHDCKNIVLRWLASKLDPSIANSAFRGISNCKLNKVCPLVFPNVTSIVKTCGSVISNRTACCKVIKSYVSNLQDQSFITNLQALKCAASLGKKLQSANVSNNVYNLCHISLKDFSLQVGSQATILPSLPTSTSSQNGLYVNGLVLLHLFTSLVLLKRLYEP